MSLFSKQKMYCNTCGVEMETDFQRFGGRVCGSACYSELEWRKTLAVMGKDYYPEPKGTWVDERPRLILMVGLPACGKSTFTKRHFVEAVRINLDTKKKRSTEAVAVLEALAEGHDIVIDNTNATLEDRARYIGIARKAGYQVWCYYFEPDVDGCKARNKARKRTVPVVAIYTINKKLVPPRKSEGFDELATVEVVVGEGNQDFEIKTLEGAE